MATPQAGLPDPRGSRAVLVGVSDYTTLEHLPAVENNITTLREVITDSDLWGLSDEHCVTLLNPTSPDKVLDAVHAAASTASEALLFYFAGHGLLNDRSDLYLGLSDSNKEQLYRAVKYDDVRQQVVETALACYGKVVILDCCFSGRALQGGMSGSVELADHARVDGTYLMTATAETSVALAPPGDEYTAFTGALVDTLVRGLPDGPDVLDMETLFHHVRADLQARHYPVPQQRTRNDGKAIALVRNRRGIRRGAPAESTGTPLRDLPKPPVGLEAVLRRRPADMYAEVQALRANGQDGFAEQVLAASAALRADQEVAAIVDLLRRQGLAVDVRTVIMAAAQRPPDEVLRIVDALHDIDLPGEAAQLVRAVGTGRVSDAANLAHLLQIDQRTDVLVELLDAALDSAQAQSSLIELVNALWVAGLRDEVDDLVHRAVNRLSGAAVVDLADELRAVGREGAAFGLYAAAATTVATRPPDVVAQLCHAMIEDGRADDGARVAQSLIERADDVMSLLDTTTAFWDNAQDQNADRTLTRAAQVLSNAGVTELATALRDRRRDDAAYQLCLRAMVGRPATAIHEILTSLRDEGRPVDARRLLDDVARQAPVRTMYDLLGKCSDGDPQRILREVTDRDPNDVAELLGAIVATQPVLARQFTDLIAARATTRAALLPIIAERLDPRSKEQMFASVVHASEGKDVAAMLQRLSSDDAKYLMFLAVQAGNPRLASIIANMPTTSNSTNVQALIDLLNQPVTRLATMIKGLLAANFEAYADAILNKIAAPERGDHAIAQDIAYLFGTGEAATGALVLKTTLRGRSSNALKNMVSAQRQHNQSEPLAVAAEWVRETYPQFGTSTIDGILRQIGLDEYTTRRTGLRRRRTNG